GGNVLDGETALGLAGDPDRAFHGGGVRWSAGAEQRLVQMEVGLDEARDDDAATPGDLPRGALGEARSDSRDAPAGDPDVATPVRVREPGAANDQVQGVRSFRSARPGSFPCARRAARARGPR